MCSNIARPFQICFLWADSSMYDHTKKYQRQLATWGRRRKEEEGGGKREEENRKGGGRREGKGSTYF